MDRNTTYLSHLVTKCQYQVLWWCGHLIALSVLTIIIVKILLSILYTLQGYFCPQNWLWRGWSWGRPYITNCIHATVYAHVILQDPEPFLIFNLVETSCYLIISPAFLSQNDSFGHNTSKPNDGVSLCFKVFRCNYKNIF